MGDVLLVSMPFGALERQALGLSLLKARLAEQGVRCDVCYLTFPFAELIGEEEYYWVCADLPHTAFAGDWTFVEALYGPNGAADARYVREVLQQTWLLDARAVDRLLRIRSLVGPFLDHCMAAVPWGRYGLVGFTSTFEQNIASLALARRIKADHPRVRIVFGGGNWEDVMGLELHRRFRFVDFACLGEADESFPALVRALRGGRLSPAARRKLKGVVYRAAGRTVAAPAAPPVADLDALPIPDYSDYFRDLDAGSAGTLAAPTLLFESSRGCWWGAKRQCTFCGLNGCTLAFRRKSAPRLLRELDHLAGRWRIDNLQATDNVLAMEYFDDLIPALAERGGELRLFYEIRACLRRDQVRLLRDAGIRMVQPGVESFSDRVLRIMRKGTGALDNIQVLKWCREYGIRAEWNVIYGFPRERRADYDQVLRLLPAIRFLPPPSACGPIRMDRFSPMFRSPSAFGIRNLRPSAPYKTLYPFDDDTLMRIAYYFDYDYEPSADPTGCAEQMIRRVNEWQRHPETGCLHAVDRDGGGLVLLDRRSDAVRRDVVLRGRDREAYNYCDRARSLSAVTRRLNRVFPDRPVTDEQVRTLLDAFAGHRLMVTDGRRYLSLAIRVMPPKPAPTNGH